MLSVRGLNLFGDPICPHCGCNIITPPAFGLVPGIGSCPACRKAFSIDRVTCERANRTAGKWNAEHGLAPKTDNQNKGQKCA
jgi:hypothetical protein